MESMRESWTDVRLDELSGRVDQGFERLSAEMRAGFEQVNSRIDRLDGRVDGLYNRMFQASVVLGAALIGLIAAIVTKL